MSLCNPGLFSAPFDPGVATTKNDILQNKLMKSHIHVLWDSNLLVLIC